MASGSASAGGGIKVVLPAPKKTGNAVRDADHANYHLMLQEMVESCVGDLDSVPPLYANQVQGEAEVDADTEHRCRHHLFRCCNVQVFGNNFVWQPSVLNIQT